MGKKVFVALVGLLLAATFAWLLGRSLDWHRVWVTLEAAHWPFLILALLFLALDYCARISRWKFLLGCTGNRVSFRNAAAATLAGFAINNILPLRIGDVTRSWMVKRSDDVALSDGIGTLLAERFWDFAILVLFFFFGAIVATPQASHGMEITVATVGGAALLAPIVITVAGDALGRLMDRAAERLSAFGAVFRFFAGLFRALSALSHPIYVGRVVILSLTVWVLEAMVLYWCGLALHMSLSAFAIAFIVSIANFSGLLPGSPGNVGTFHFFAVLAAGAFGIKADNAAALAILFHALMWLPITAAGGIALLLDPGPFGGFLGVFSGGSRGKP